MSSAITLPVIPYKPFSNQYADGKLSKLLICPQVVSSSRRRLPGCSAHLVHAETTGRRSGNYGPPLWDSHFIQSLDHQYKEERHSLRTYELIEQVKILLDEYQEMELVQVLGLIDDLQNLGISYHFEQKISHILNTIYVEHKHMNNKDPQDKDYLYSTALAFRLLRQHGFKLSQEVFNCFMNEEGDYKASLSDDVKGLLQLYEASFLWANGETTLELAREFSWNILRKKVDEEGSDGIDEHLLLLVRRAMEVPLDWRTPRAQTRWFINAYPKKPDMNPVLLQLAKLDFNIVQAIHREELQQLSRWWKHTNLVEILPFARDRLVECYLLTIGLFEPKYGYSRIIGTKVNAFVTIMDDMFDVYGTMEELILFNDVIQRWDIEAMEQLPNYMQICFLALNNFINDMAYDVLKEQGFYTIPYLRKSWADLCTTYIQEAKWYSDGYQPTLEEYMSNAWISISVPVMLSHAYFALTNPIKKGVVESLHKYHDLVKYTGTIARLANDLGTSPDEMKRGDVPKSIQCYINEKGGENEDAREYMKIVISETWKKMNNERVTNTQFPKELVRCGVEFGRIAHHVYQNGDGDGHGIQNPLIKDQISNLFFDPIL